MIAECIKEAFHITNKNWQVVLLQIIVLLINFIGFFLFIGVPLAITIVSLGIDIAHTKDLLQGIFEDPSQFFSKYLGLTILIFVTVILYLISASFLVIYSFGGMLGTLRNAVMNKQFKFNFSTFFSEAKRLFISFLLLLLLTILIVIGILIATGFFAGTIVSIIDTYAGRSATPLSIFTTYFVGLIGIILCFFIIIFSSYTAIALAVEKGKKVLSSFRNTINFIKAKPTAFLFYIIIVVGIILINFILITIGAIFSMLPKIGFLISIPYQIFYYCIVQSYLTVLMWGSLLVFYIKNIHLPGYGITYDI